MKFLQLLLIHAVLKTPPFRVLLFTALTTVLMLAAPMHSRSTPSTVANYRVEISAELLQSWQRFRELGTARDRKTEDVDPDQALREMVLTMTLSDEARRRGLDRTPETLIEFTNLEAKRVQPLFQERIEASVQVSEAEVDARFQEIRLKATTPRKVRLYNLFKRFPENATEADRAALRQQMASLRRQIEDQEDFMALAERESDSQTRFQRGLLGNVRSGTLRPAIDAVAMAMQAGEISDVLEGSEGLTLLYCERVFESTLRTPEEMREIARQQVEAFKWNQAWERQQASALEEAEARFRWQILNAEQPSGNEVLVDLRGGVLTLGEALLLTRTDLEALRELPRERSRERLEPHLRRRALLRHAEVEGLLNDELQEQLVWTRQQVLAGKALAALVQERFAPLTEKEIRTYFEAHRERFKRPAHYKITAIALSLDAQDPRSAYAQGWSLLTDLRDGRLDFAQAAREHSVDPTAKAGGEIGWVSRWNLPKRLGFNALKQLLSMKVGERSSLVQDGQLLWILELRNLEEARPMTFEEARQGAENALGSERVRQLETQITEAWLANLELELVAVP